MTGTITNNMLKSIFSAVLVMVSLTSISSVAFAAQTTICIDPGHPSESGRGTQGRHLTEIDAAWQVAQILKEDLAKRGYRVVLTKQSAQEFVTNKRRAQIANDCNSALLLRLHCDADAGTGIASYAPDRQGTANGVTGPDKRIIEESQNALREFYPAMIKSLDGLLANRGMFADTSTRIGGKQGALTGSIYSKVPVILVEMCVLTNPHDEAIISSAVGKQRIAAALTAGVNAAVPVGESNPIK
jgi:N-acetylmuramoyl-L-alanine amidase